MRLPESFIEVLSRRGIKKPTPVQMQGLPEALLHRDLIVFASGRSGKTLLMILPLLVLAIEEENKMPIIKGEGPFGLVIVPSHELAIQITQTIEEYSQDLRQRGYPPLRTLLLIGGIDLTYNEKLQKGVHIIVGTPGRLSDMLKKKRFNLEMCRMFCLDEADRLLDTAFGDDLNFIFSEARPDRQVMVLSSTTPKKIQEFAIQHIDRPVVISVGLVTKPQLKVNQEIEYVKREDKIKSILNALQKTPPPVIIFTENKNEVDLIHEYLLIKGVEAVSLHGGKDQDERSTAIDLFKEGKCDVLVSTDVAAKGLHFSNIRHVINFDLPKQIDDYIHRIGRTGCENDRGLATTFVSKGDDYNTLLDLKDFLIETNEPVPPFLKALGTQNDDKIVCLYCHSEDHKMKRCKKFESDRLRGLAFCHS